MAPTTRGNETEGCVGNTINANGTEDAEQYEEPTGLRIFRLVAFSLITLASLIGNSVICKVVWSKPSHKPFSYHLVANMALAEILSSLCLPFILADWELESSNTILNKITCVLHPLQVLSIMVVTHSMAAVAFYRFRVLINPFSQAPSRNVKTIAITCLWIIAAAICVPTFLGFKFVNGMCDLQPVSSNKTHVVAIFVVNFAVPYFVILVSYGAVALNLRKRIVEKAARERSSVNSSTAAVEMEDAVELQGLADNKERQRNLAECQRKALNEATRNRRCSKSENLEKDLLKMIYAIILIYMICYFPHQAIYLWERIAEIDSWQFYYHALLQKYVFVLTCLPSALHPLCYGTMNKFYAKAFSRIFLCKKISNADRTVKWLLSKCYFQIINR